MVLRVARLTRFLTWQPRHLVIDLGTSQSWTKLWTYLVRAVFWDDVLLIRVRVCGCASYLAVGDCVQRGGVLAVHVLVQYGDHALGGVRVRAAVEAMEGACVRREEENDENIEEQTMRTRTKRMYWNVCIDTINGFSSSVLSDCESNQSCAMSRLAARGWRGPATEWASMSLSGGAVRHRQGLHFCSVSTQCLSSLFQVSLAHKFASIRFLSLPPLPRHTTPSPSSSSSMTTITLPSFNPGALLLHAGAAATMAYGYFGLHSLPVNSFIESQRGGHFQFLTIQG